jgi:membrane-bound ClpP family serine protease
MRNIKTSIYGTAILAVSAAAIVYAAFTNLGWLTVAGVVALIVGAFVVMWSANKLFISEGPNKLRIKILFVSTSVIWLPIMVACFGLFGMYAYLQHIQNKRRARYVNSI